MGESVGGPAYYCGRCGEARVAVSGAACLGCRNRWGLEDVACEVCGKPSEFMDAKGFRCWGHRDAAADSPAGVDPRVVCVGGTLLPSYFERVRRNLAGG